MLTKEDEPQVRDILKSRRRFILSKMKIDVNEHHMRYIANYLDGSQERYFLVGKFESGILNAMIGMCIWDAFPYATLGFQVSRPTKERFYNPTENGIAECLNKCIEICEGFEVYRWYAWMRKSTLWANLKVWQSPKVPKLKNYYSFTECTVSSNEMPPWSGYYNIVDSRTWPFDIVIRCTILKKEYQEDTFFKKCSIFGE